MGTPPFKWINSGRVLETVNGQAKLEYAEGVAEQGHMETTLPQPHTLGQVPMRE